MTAETLREAAERLRDGGVNRLTTEVGLGLADVLDEMARDVDLLNDAAPRPCSEETLAFNLSAYRESLSVARVILGGDA